jgi:hypothetical protein
MKIPEFLIDADNVYRTKYFIIKQVLVLDRTCDEDNNITSYDTFYKRTKQRDKEYELVFADKNHIDGKRLPSTMCSRKYVD